MATEPSVQPSLPPSRADVRAQAASGGVGGGIPVPTDSVASTGRTEARDANNHGGTL